MTLSAVVPCAAAAADAPAIPSASAAPQPTIIAAPCRCHATSSRIFRFCTAIINRERSPLGLPYVKKKSRRGRVDGGSRAWPIGRREPPAAMPKITYTDNEGTARTVEAELGATVMETAIKNDIPGILATCGGSCSCATCHVYVDEEWLEKLPPPALEESDMLDTAHDLKDELPPVLPDRGHRGARRPQGHHPAAADLTIHRQPISRLSRWPEISLALRLVAAWLWERLGRSAWRQGGFWRRSAACCFRPASASTARRATTPAASFPGRRTTSRDDDLIAQNNCGMYQQVRRDHDHPPGLRRLHHL